MDIINPHSDGKLYKLYKLQFDYFSKTLQLIQTSCEISKPKNRSRPKRMISRSHAQRILAEESAFQNSFYIEFQIR